MFDLFLSPQGRIGRTWYWLGFICQAALLVPLCFQIYSAAKNRDFSGLAMWVLAIVAFLLWSSFCITAKRLHDRGKPAWFYLFQFIPGIGLWIVVECGFLAGDAAANSYGPPPGASLGPAKKTDWDAPDGADNSAAIDAMIARSLQTRAAPVPAMAVASSAAAAPGRRPSVAPVFGRRR